MYQLEFKRYLYGLANVFNALSTMFFYEER